MSRVGKNAISIPSGVTVAISGLTVDVKGKLGNFKHALPEGITPVVQDNVLVLEPRDKSKQIRTLWGTNQRVLSNMVKGVTDGFTVNLEIVGVGYRAALQGKDLVLQLGYSHDVKFPIPEGITIKCEKPTAVSISGSDKQKVGQVAAVIRGFRPPEPYKGKGIKYENEIILRKEGKKK